MQATTGHLYSGLLGNSEEPAAAVAKIKAKAGYQRAYLALQQQFYDLKETDLASSNNPLRCDPIFFHVVFFKKDLDRIDSRKLLHFFFPSRLDITPPLIGR